jgi:site-specific DNA recombinase
LTRTLENAGPGEWVQFLNNCLSRVTVDTDTLTLVINQGNLAERLAIPHPDNGSFEHRVACKFVNRGGQLKLIIRPEDESLGGIDATLIKSIARAHAWFERLQDGRAKSVRDIAEQENLSTAYVMRYLRLAFLAPDIIEAILKGKQPPGISVRRLTNNKQLPSNWAEQRRLLNFPAA